MKISTICPKSNHYYFNVFAMESLAQKAQRKKIQQQLRVLRSRHGDTVVKQVKNPGFETFLSTRIFSAR